MIRSWLAVGAAVLALAACGAPDGSPQGSGRSEGSPAGTTTAGEREPGMTLIGPPPFRLRYDGGKLALRPYTWCYGNGCADGIPPDPPPSVGSPAAIRVYPPVEGWELTAGFTPAGKRCGRIQDVTPSAQSDGAYLLEPAGRAGRYDVTLFARGRGGDAFTVFRWTTPSDGQMPAPTARLSLIADHDGRPDSYGVELMLENLAETPRVATAQITVTAANGRSLTFNATLSAERCLAEGTVFFDGPDAQGKAAAALGDFPFRYDVMVTLDGTTYRATATYPADEIPDNEPSVALDFSPALPALE